MEALILLGLIFFVSGPVAIVIALVLLGRVRRLEDELRAWRRELLTAKPVASTPPPVTVAPTARVPAADSSGLASPAPPVAAAREVPAEATAPAPAAPSPPAERPMIETPRAAAESATTTTPPLRIPPLPDEPAVSLEERLGARLPVWIGSIALTLAGAFLVKYSFDHGWVTPTMRVALGLLLGVSLLGVGEWMRPRVALIGRGLTAAGIADLFAALLAGVHLYHLIPPLVGFGLMAATAGAAVVLSLRQGPMIAVIGLVGGFLTPALIGSENPNPWGLFGYLFLLQVCLLTVTRRRAWMSIAAMTLIGSVLWALSIHALQDSARFIVPAGLFMVATTLLFLWAARPGTDTGWGGAKDAWMLRAIASGLGLVGTGAIALRHGFGPTEWGFLAIVSLALIVLARFDAGLQALPLCALAASLVIYLISATMTTDPLDTSTAGWTAIAMGALFAVGSSVALLRAQARAALATTAALSVALFFAAAWWVLSRVPDFTPMVPWGIIALACGGVTIAMAFVVARRDRGVGDTEQALAACALAATGLIAAAVPLELERAWLTVAWALQAAALAWIYPRVRVDALPFAAGALACAVMVRLLLNPAVVLEYPIGTTPLVNWLAYGYGVPIVAFIVGAVAARREGPAWLARLLEWSAVLLGTALVALNIRHLWHPFDGLGFRPEQANDTLFSEASAYAVALGILGLLLTWASKRLQDPPALYFGGPTLAGFSLMWALLIVGLIENPVFSGDPVGGLPVINLLWFGYGVPAVVALLLGSWLSKREKFEMFGPASQALALVLAFVLLTLQVRQAFHGTILKGGGVSDAEMWSYSIAYLLFGTALLIFGIRVDRALLRHASLAVMLVAVGKVFLFDTSELHDLWRVVSYLGLGVSLMFLAWLYRRFVIAVKTP